MTFPQLLAALSEKLELELVDEGGATAIEIDGTTIVLQEAGDGLLLMHADLGEIPPDRRESLASAALQANYLYQGTGGSTLAANPSDGHLHLQRYNWLDRSDADKSLDALSRFADTAFRWKELLSAPLEAPAEEAGAPSDFSLASGYMKM